jgi:hypothetical protein
MATKSDRSKKKPTTRWHDGSTPIEDLAPNEQLAHRLVSQFRDLAPSVERIMDAELDEDQRGVALTAFGESLGKVGDPNRDPRVAIANASVAG